MYQYFSYLVGLVCAYPRPFLEDGPQSLENLFLQLAAIGQVHHVARCLDVVGEDVVLVPLFLLRRFSAATIVVQKTMHRWEGGGRQHLAPLELRPRG